MGRVLGGVCGGGPVGGRSFMWGSAALFVSEREKVLRGMEYLGDVLPEISRKIVWNSRWMEENQEGIPKKYGLRLKKRYPAWVLHQQESGCLRSAYRGAGIGCLGRSSGRREAADPYHSNSGGRNVDRSRHVFSSDRDSHRGTVGTLWSRSTALPSSNGAGINGAGGFGSGCTRNS